MFPQPLSPGRKLRCNIFLSHWLKVTSQVDPAEPGFTSRNSAVLLNLEPEIGVVEGLQPSRARTRGPGKGILGGTPVSRVSAPPRAPHLALAGNDNYNRSALRRPRHSHSCFGYTFPLIAKPPN